jgi:hypothetical protein
MLNAITDVRTSIAKAAIASIGRLAKGFQAERMPRSSRIMPTGPSVAAPTAFDAYHCAQ